MTAEANLNAAGQALGAAFIALQHKRLSPPKSPATDAIDRQSAPEESAKGR
jgi:hypothetical protein